MKRPVQGRFGTLARGVIAVLIAGVSLAGCSLIDQAKGGATPSLPPPPQLTSEKPIPPGSDPHLAQLSGAGYQVIGEYELEEPLFVQGAEFIDNDRLLISTGRYDHSRILILNHATGEIEKSTANNPDDFGEGATRVGDNYLQMTWKEGKTYLWDADLKLLKTLPNDRDGWGLCYNAKEDVLFATDGSAEVTLRSPETFAAISRFKVSAEGKPAERLNELECVGDTIYANIFMSPTIVRFTPDNTAAQVFDLRPIKEYIMANKYYGPDVRSAGSVLNGIAYRPSTDTFFLFGKNWTRYFEVKFL